MNTAKRTREFAFAVATVCSAAGLFPSAVFGQPRTELGSINGAQFRIRFPEKWNGTLLMWCHGYDSQSGVFQKDQKPSAFEKQLIAEGYAYAESGYSKGGMAIAEGIADTEALRRHFTAKHTKPARVFVIGESLGGLIALALTESMPSYYNGGVAFSGLLSAPQPFLKRAAFDLLVLYRHYFHGILPSPAHVGFSYAPDQQTLDRVTASLASNEAAAAPLRAYSGARNNQDLTELLVFHTDALRDLQQRCGGNPFDNRQTLYTLGSESAVVNAGVERYSAESVAEACARNLPRPTAKLTVPFLAVDAAYDPVVPAWSGNQYASEIESAGKREWFVRQFVSEQGHCAINTESRLSALRAMVRWVEQGIRPLDGRQ